MKIYFFLLSSLSLFILYGCSNNAAGSKDNFITYSSKGNLIPFNVTISLEGDELFLFLSDTSKNRYKIAAAELEEIYSFVDKIKYFEIVLPPAEKRMDATEINFSVQLNGKKRDMSLGLVKDIPQPIIDLRSKLFDLATVYQPSWKNEAGF
jgi:hypothetical protein